MKFTSEDAKRVLPKGVCKRCVFKTRKILENEVGTELVCSRCKIKIDVKILLERAKKLGLIPDETHKRFFGSD